MEKKFYLTQGGKKVTFGDWVEWSTEEKKEGYYSCKSYKVLLTEDTVDSLLKDGIISEVAEEEKMFNAVELIAKRLNLTTEEAFKFLSPIVDNYPGTALQMMLKELALKANKKHKRSWRSYKVVYGVSLVDLSVIELPTEKIIFPENIAIFKSREDAETAIKALTTCDESED